MWGWTTKLLHFSRLTLQQPFELKSIRQAVSNTWDLVNANAVNLPIGAAPSKQQSCVR
jgi:hypothetical protein